MCSYLGKGFTGLETPLSVDPLSMIRPSRKVHGVSAILLPFTEYGEVDWDSFAEHLQRTVEAGLTPAVNMDTGYVDLIDDDTRQTVLAHAKEALSNRTFFAGAFIADNPGDQWNPDAYRCQIEIIQRYGAVPVIFQSYGITNQDSDAIASAYADLADDCPQFIVFELGRMFAPYGKIYDLETYAKLLSISQCVGAKHSSLSRDLEWQRLVLRDRLRPDFRIYTGNDLAIDMIMYGSDYLLGLSTFAPDWFAYRDKLWELSNPTFYELNDLLQYLGFFTFRYPTPAYKHSAAQFLKLRGWIRFDTPPPTAQRRPDSDIIVLEEILKRLNSFREE